MEERTLITAIWVRRMDTGLENLQLGLENVQLGWGNWTPEKTMGRLR